MWYLVIPPIVVILCLSLLLWYLSRKDADPEIQEKIAATGAVQAPAFSRTREFFLRILEKTTQKYKVRSLRMHNALDDWSQSLKERRRRFREPSPSAPVPPLASPEAPEIQAVSPAPHPPVQSEVPRARRAAFLKFWKKDETEGVPGNAAPTFHPVPESQEKSAAPQARPGLPERFVRRPRETAVGDETPVRPMVSERMTRPEAPRKKIRSDVVREEELIGRIATNPKDFTAYETLGDYYMETGNIKDAKECYRQVLRLRPIHRMVKIKIRRLEKLLVEKANTNE